MKRCARCKRTAAPGVTICNGCGDPFVGNYLPMALAVAVLIPAVGFVAVASQQPGFYAHPGRVALAKLGLGPSEEAISSTLVEEATRDGVVKRQRDLFAFEVDGAAWRGLSEARRSELEEAFVQRIYGRELRNDEIVYVYAGSSRHVVAAIGGSPRLS
jgi:hypothetical protein